MTVFEFVRLAGYTISAPLLLWIALGMARSRMHAQALFLLSICLLFCWYMVDVTMVSAGTSTRETRNTATLLVVMATCGAVWMAIKHYQWRRKGQHAWHSKRQKSG